jgi:hypothetical protein
VRERDSGRIRQQYPQVGEGLRPHPAAVSTSGRGTRQWRALWLHCNNTLTKKGVRQWRATGGVLLIGYEKYRQLVLPSRKYAKQPEVLVIITILIIVIVLQLLSPTYTICTHLRVYNGSPYASAFEPLC